MQSARSTQPNFNPLRPCGRRPFVDETSGEFIDNFNPLRPCGRRRGRRSCPQFYRADFNPLRPCGRRHRCANSFCTAFGFQSTPPVWAETGKNQGVFPTIDFNPLRPCGRRRDWLSTCYVDNKISIHSARVGGDLYRISCRHRITIFQSTPPVWAETAKETIFSSLKHLYYNIFYRKKQENSM